jgi:hypothetical protein
MFRTSVFHVLFDTSATMSLAHRLQDQSSLETEVPRGSRHQACEKLRFSKEQSRAEGPEMRPAATAG